jgi:hypothetical protein
MRANFPAKGREDQTAIVREFGNRSNACGKDEGGSVALNPDPMSGMKDEPNKAAEGRESDSSFRLHPSSFKKGGFRDRSADPRRRNAIKSALSKFSPRKFRSQLKLQQTGKPIFLNSQRPAILGLGNGCVTRGTRAGSWKILRSQVEYRKHPAPSS